MYTSYEEAFRCPIVLNQACHAGHNASPKYKLLLKLIIDSTDMVTQ